MASAFDKSINLGLGFLMYSKEKVEEFVDEMVGRGEVAKNDARRFANELIQRGEVQREELKKLIQAETDKALGKADLVKKENLVTKDELRATVKEEVERALRAAAAEASGADE